MADELIIKDFDQYHGSCDQAEALHHFEVEATPVKIPEEENETTEQRAQRLDRQRLENDKVKEQKKFYEAAQREPELATKLYNIREATRNEQPLATVVHMKVDNEGHPYAKIHHQMSDEEKKLYNKIIHQMADDGKNINAQLIEKMADGHFSFSIHDGKIIFDQMNEAQIASALMYLYHRGITNFEFPAGVDKDFVEKYQKAQEIKNQNPESYQPPKENHASIGFEYDSEAPQVTNGNAAQAAATPQQSTPTQTQTPAQQTPAPAATPAKPKPTYDEVVKDFEKWLGDDNQKKVSGLTYFKTGTSLLNGNITFSIYDKPHEDNYKNDGRPDKKGHYTECAYRICLRQDHGKLCGIDYYVPNDGKLPDPVADKLALMVKAQGALYMKLPKTLAPSDAGVFRNACARAGIIPKGIGINKFHANKMITEAENNIQDEKALYKYKGNLGRHLLELGKNDPKDPRYVLAMSLINQEKLFPLKQQLEGCLTDKLTKRVEGGKAEEVIGAAQTMKQLFTTISAQPDMSIGQLCQKLAPQDRAFEAELLQKLQAVGATDKTASSLDDNQMIALYETLEARNIETAKNTLIDKIKRNGGKDSVDTIVEREVNSANKALNITINKGLRDKGFKDGFNTIDFGTPTFDIPANTNTNTNNQPAPTRSTSRGGASI